MFRTHLLSVGSLQGQRSSCILCQKGEVLLSKAVFGHSFSFDKTQCVPPTHSVEFNIVYSDICRTSLNVCQYVRKCQQLVNLFQIHPMTSQSDASVCSFLLLFP